MRRMLAFGGLAIVLSARLATAADPRNLEEARMRFKEGRALANAGDMEGARVKFAQANALVRSTDTLWNLAAAEVGSGHLVEALNHYYVFLRDPKAEPSRIEEARAKWIPLVSARVGQLRLDAPTASVIELDNRDKLGVAPFPDPVAVEPGAHRLQAHVGDKTIERTIDVRAGGVTTVSFAESLVTPPMAPAATPPAPAAPTPTSAPPTVASTEGEPEFWTTSRVVGATFAGLAVVSLGTGIVLGLAANSNKSHLDDLSAQQPSSSACKSPSSPYCASLHDAESSQRTDAHWSTVGFVAAGVFTLGAATMWFLVPSSHESATHSALWVSPSIAPGSSGFVAGGHF